MAVLRMLSRQGDTSAEWAVDRAGQGGPEAVAAVREAERIFGEQRPRGAVAFIGAPDRPAQRLDRFDPRAEQIVIVPRVAGG